MGTFWQFYVDGTNGFMVPNKGKVTGGNGTNDFFDVFMITAPEASMPCYMSFADMAAAVRVSTTTDANEIVTEWYDNSIKKGGFIYGLQ